MTHKDGKPVLFTFDDEIAERFCRIRSVMTLRMVLCIYRNVFVKSSVVGKYVSKSSGDVEKGLRKIKNLRLVKKYVDNNTRETYYAVDLALINDFPCATCPKGKQVGAITKCRSKISCVYNYRRYAYSLIRMMKKEKLITETKFLGEIKNRKFEIQKPTKPVKGWNSKDFTQYMRFHYNDYSHIMTIKSAVVAKGVTKLKQLFIIEFQDDWRRILKRYIKYQFKQAEIETYIPSMKVMALKESVQKFVDQDKAVSLDICAKYNLHCPYWKSGCVLTHKCKKSLRKKIRKSYND